jgi:Ni2+-binding GTPase involved in maturation of urease and hydrogenase
MTLLPKFVMVGGFLGAGKTTTIARLAKHYQATGKRVAIVTNDQATDLVDTNLLRAQGFDVGEVAGSCFCCNFNELTRTIESLGADRPDVFLAEPAGSCTDLVATVIRPLQQIYNQPFDIAPYGVIIKPSHGMKILRQSGKGGFSPQAEYIFRKQIEEADFVILNRIDQLAEQEIVELERLLENQFVGIPCLRVSALTGAGFDALCDYLDQQGMFGQRLMDVDYDVYAEGEAELGWLNAQAEIQSDAAWDLDGCLIDLLQHINRTLNRHQAEVAHLKVMGMENGLYAVANLISSTSDPQLSIGSGARTRRAEMVINARVAVDPEILADIVRGSLEEVCDPLGARPTIRALQSFRPGRPVPSYRIANA